MGRNYFRGAFSNNDSEKDQHVNEFTIRLTAGGQEEINSRYGSFSGMLRQVVESEQAITLPVEKIKSLISTEDGTKIKDEIYPIYTVISPSYDLYDLIVSTKYERDYKWQLEKLIKEQYTVVRTRNICPVKIELRINHYEKENITITCSIQTNDNFSVYEMANSVNALISFIKKFSVKNPENKKIKRLQVVQAFWDKLYNLEQKFPDTKFKILRNPSESDIENVEELYYSIVKSKVIRQNVFASSMSITFDTKENLDKYVEKIPDTSVLYGYSFSSDLDILGNTIHIYSRYVMFNVIPKITSTNNNQVVIALEGSNEFQPYTSFIHSLNNTDIDVDSIIIELFKNAKTLDELKAETDEYNSCTFK